MWKNVTDTNYLLYEFVNPSALQEKDIFVTQKGSSSVKHIFAVLEIKKMIPVPDGCFEEIDINKIPDPAYKNLLEKERLFLRPKFSDIQEKAKFLYHFQKKTGKVFTFYCNFSKLEKVCDTYKI